mmetsp:Transcript_15272/g.59707  ORF Transcript_15272/g.59707 Transcript_15272/m.59707 type:complete len:207 (+) Transcript_15272:682-1302(+)
MAHLYLTPTILTPQASQLAGCIAPTARAGAGAAARAGAASAPGRGSHSASAMEDSSAFSSGLASSLMRSCSTCSLTWSTDDLTWSTNVLTWPRISSASLESDSAIFFSTMTSSADWPTDSTMRCTSLTPSCSATGMVSMNLKNLCSRPISGWLAPASAGASPLRRGREEEGRAGTTGAEGANIERRTCSIEVLTWMESGWLPRTCA